MHRLKHFSLIFGFVLLLYSTLPSLNPWNHGMFGFQDPTQVGRVTSFVNNLKSLHIPPRLAPEYSFHLGFPVFNFYAPTAYWLTSLIALLGISSITAVKLSFLFAMILSFFGMFALLLELLELKQKLSAVVGACVYVTTTYFATEIVVRGNLAECWFLALLPVCLALMIKNSKTQKVWWQIATTLTLALLFTSHNMMLILAVPISFIFMLFFPNKKRNVLAVSLALLIDSYFLIPAFMEGSLVQATKVAKEYIYTDHFLCLWQVWTAKGWVFGGSLPGCDNPLEMSYKLGKIQVGLGLLGVVFFLFNVLKKKTLKKAQLPFTFIALITFGSLFLTLNQSLFIWKLFEPLMSLFQFPWRFLVIVMFGSAVFAGYAFQHIPSILQKMLFIPLLFILFIPARKYFITPTIPFATYQTQYNSEKYLSQHLAYKMPEYLVTDADLPYWRSLEPTEQKPLELTFDPNRPIQFDGTFDVTKNEPFEKEIQINDQGVSTLNIHYFPFWQIFINQQRVIPTYFDKLARPVLQVQSGDVLEVKYIQTTTEKITDLLTLLGIISTCVAALALRKTDTRTQP